MGESLTELFEEFKQQRQNQGFILTGDVSGADSDQDINEGLVIGIFAVFDRIAEDCLAVFFDRVHERATDRNAEKGIRIHRCTGEFLFRAD
jgi:hypothetical protein